MKSHLVAILLTCFSFTAFCQEDIKDEVSKLMQSGDFAGAMQKVNECLTKDPKNIDGLIMKSNVLINRFVASQPQISLSGNSDESIYEEDIGSIEEAPIIIPVDTANIIVAPLLKALEIDKTRKDIYFGVCTVYSYSMQLDKLNNYLPIVIKNIPVDDDLPYTLADYAVNFGQRKDFEDEMKVYNKLAELFPNSAGIMGDIAAQYVAHNDMKKAKESIDLAMKRPGADKLTYRNAFTINGLLENYDEAIKMCYKADSTLGYFYECLVKLSRGNDWKTSLSKWYVTFHDYADPARLASQLLSTNMNNGNATTDTLINLQLTDAYKIPVLRYFKEHSPYFLPAFKYAEALTYNSRYSDAVKAFKEIKTDTITALEKEDLNFYMAWALYKNGDKKEANTHWEPLLKSTDFYHKSAAAYFIGKSYLDTKDSAKAKQYFSMVSDSASKSKYANFCSNLLKGN